MDTYELQTTPLTGKYGCGVGGSGSNNTTVTQGAGCNIRPYNQDSHNGHTAFRSKYTWRKQDKNRGQFKYYNSNKRNYEQISNQNQNGYQQHQWRSRDFDQFTVNANSSYRPRHNYNHERGSPESMSTKSDAPRNNCKANCNQQERSTGNNATHYRSKKESFKSELTKGKNISTPLPSRSSIYQTPNINSSSISNSRLETKTDQSVTSAINALDHHTNLNYVHLNAAGSPLSVTETTFPALEKILKPAEFQNKEKQIQIEAAGKELDDISDQSNSEEPSNQTEPSVTSTFKQDQTSFTSVNYLAANKSEANCPKISIIPINRLLRNELKNVTELGLSSSADCGAKPSTEDTTEVSSTPFKQFCRPTLVKRRRIISCSESLNNNKDTIVEKVASMKKNEIMDVINSRSSKYDEALKLQARKSLRDEMRKQIKSMTVERPKDICNTEVVPDDIVESIHIPDVLLDEIRTAFGLELNGPSTLISGNSKENTFDIPSMRNVENDSSTTESCIESISNKESDPHEASNELNQLARSLHIVESERIGSEKPCNDLMSRLKEAAKVRSALDKTFFKTVPERDLRSKSPSNDGNSKLETTIEERKRPQLTVRPTRNRDHLDNKRVKISKPNDVILIASSSSESSTSSSSSSSDSSTSSECVSESANVTHTTSSKPSKIKLKLDEKNIITNFEKLIQPSLTQSLVKRYQTKYSDSIKAKLHFISCVCTSDYNSAKFRKVEIAKVQRNLKSEDNSMALEFLMHEIVNVFNYQKKIAKWIAGRRRCNREFVGVQTNEDSMLYTNKPRQGGDIVECNWIEPASQADSIKSKCANAAEKANADDNVQPQPSRKGHRSGRLVVTSSKHQSANEHTLMKESVGDKHAGEAELCDEIGKSDVNSKLKTRNSIPTKGNKNYDSISSDEINDSDIIKKRLEKSSQQTNLAAFSTNALWLPSRGVPYNHQLGNAQQLNLLALDNKQNYISGLSDIPKISSVGCSALFPTIDLHALRQKSLIGESVFNNVKQIDMQLIELQKRKIVVNDLVMKLEKEKIDIDLQTIKLQNEKFLLLNSAMASTTTNATEILNAESSSFVMVEEKGCQNTKEDEGTIAKFRKIRSHRRNRSKRQSFCASKRRQQKRNVTQLQYSSSTVLSDSLKGPEENNTPVPNQTECHSEESDCDIPSGFLEDVKSPLTQIRVFENNIVACSEDGHIYKYNMSTLKLEKRFARHTEAITQIYLCKDRKILYTTSLDGYLKKTSVENLEIDIQSLYLEEPLQSIDVSWGTAFIGSRWGNIFSYNTITNHSNETILCSSNTSIIAIKATKEGPRKILIISSKGHLIHIRDAVSGLLLRTMELPSDIHIYSLLLDSSCIFCGTQKNNIFKYDFTTGNRLSTFSCGNGAVSLKIYKAKFILVGCYDGFIYVLDKETGNQIAQLPGSGKMVLTLEVIGNKIITSAKDKTLKIIDIPKHIVERANA